ncbi:Panacea domain-containing protein [Vreelandella sp. H-I2]
MTYQLNTIANAFIRKARDSGNNDLTPMKLLKLVYIAHGWSLGINNRPLFLEEVQAWKYGPVIPELYEQVKQYRSSPIQSELEEPSFNSHIDEGDQALIDQVWNTYGKHDGIRLSSITHKPGTPWDKTWDNRGLQGLIIPTPLIRDHYQQLARA